MIFIDRTELELNIRNARIPQTPPNQYPRAYQNATIKE